MSDQPRVHVRFMFNVRLVCPSRTHLNVDAAEANVRPLVSKESGTLLDRIRIAYTETSRHVCHRQSFNGESTVHRLATYQNVRIGITPLDPWRSSAPSPVDLKNFS
jgi:hypothetical protein